MSGRATIARSNDVIKLDAGAAGEFWNCEQKDGPKMISPRQLAARLEIVEERSLSVEVPQAAKQATPHCLWID
jgi:hypothetical protein